MQGSKRLLPSTDDAQSMRVTVDPLNFLILTIRKPWHFPPPSSLLALPGLCHKFN